MGFSFKSLLKNKIKDKRIRVFGKIYRISAKKQFCTILICLIVCISVGLYINHTNALRPAVADASAGLEVSAQDTHESTQTNTPTVTPTAFPQKKILLHISGAVNKPGVVVVKENARLADAVEAAGGLKNDCDLSQINLAAFVTDGMKVHIPFVGQTPIVILSSPAAQSVIQPTKTPAMPTVAQKVNINTAGIVELTRLSGIGESTAKKIIAYREENGRFGRIEDILQVSGIGEAKFRNIKNDICV